MILKIRVQNDNKVKNKMSSACLTPLPYKSYSRQHLCLFNFASLLSTRSSGDCIGRPTVRAFQFVDFSFPEELGIRKSGPLLSIPEQLITPYRSGVVASENNILSCSQVLWISNSTAGMVLVASPGKTQKAGDICTHMLGTWMGLGEGQPQGRCLPWLLEL